MGSQVDLNSAVYFVCCHGDPEHCPVSHHAADVVGFGKEDGQLNLLVKGCHAREDGAPNIWNVDNVPHCPDGSPNTWHTVEEHTVEEHKAEV